MQPVRHVTYLGGDSEGDGRASRVGERPLALTPRVLGGRDSPFTQLDAARANYRSIRYVRSPLALSDDSIFSPPLLPRMLTKPRIVCFCQPVAASISASVTPLARFISAITSAFLLLLSGAGFLAGAFAGFFGLALFLALGAPFFLVRFSGDHHWPDLGDHRGRASGSLESRPEDR